MSRRPLSPAWKGPAEAFPDGPCVKLSILCCWNALSAHYDYQHYGRPWFPWDWINVIWTQPQHGSAVYNEQSPSCGLASASQSIPLIFNHSSIRRERRIGDGVTGNSSSEATNSNRNGVLSWFRHLHSVFCRAGQPLVTKSAWATVTK